MTFFSVSRELRLLFKLTITSPPNPGCLVRVANSPQYTDKASILAHLDVVIVTHATHPLNPAFVFHCLFPMRCYCS